MRLWIRNLDSPDPRVVAGTEMGEFGTVAFWSPDSRFFAFFVDGQLKRVDRLGGPPQKVCDLPAMAIGGTWSHDGTIVVGNNGRGGLQGCPASGGAAFPLTHPDTAGGEADLLPSFLEDGRRFLYLHVSRAAPERTGIRLGSLGVAPERQSTERLLVTGFGAAYVPGAEPGNGEIVFVRDLMLFAQRFDTRRLELVGEPRQLGGPVGSFLDYAFFTVSNNGVLAYQSPGQNLQLTWFDRQGTSLGRVGDAGPYTALDLSPSGAQAITIKHVAQNTADEDLWLFDLARGSTKRLSVKPLLPIAPVWAPDSRRVFFSDFRRLRERSVTEEGVPRVVMENAAAVLNLQPTSVSADSRWLLETSIGSGPTRTDIWLAPLDGRAQAAVPLLHGEADEGQAQFSPDGRWMAYVSNQSGRNEVVVARLVEDARSGFLAVEDGQQVSRGGGIAPRWRRDGREILYRTIDGQVLAVEVNTDKGLVAGEPHALFRAPGALPDWGVTADGRRFLLAVPVGSASASQLEVILNWQVEPH
jgi:hypothetical protein